MADNDTLILVDEHDNELGYESKQKAHDGKGLLHRAFSILIFNSKGEMLLQQRSSQKRLWNGYWANACCSHPRKGEQMEDAIHRRLQEELGFDTQLKYLYKFTYQARSGGGSEHELCSVFIGRHDGEIRPDPAEVSAIKWMPLHELSRDVAQHPESYTPWFKAELTELRRHSNELKALGVPHVLGFHPETRKSGISYV